MAKRTKKPTPAVAAAPRPYDPARWWTADTHDYQGVMPESEVARKLRLAAEERAREVKA